MLGNLEPEEKIMTEPTVMEQVAAIAKNMGGKKVTRFLLKWQELKSLVLTWVKSTTKSGNRLLEPVSIIRTLSL